MKRYGMTIRIRPGSEDAYRQYHAEVWPEASGLYVPLMLNLD